MLAVAKATQMVALLALSTAGMTAALTVDQKDVLMAAALAVRKVGLSEWLRVVRMVIELVESTVGH